MFDPRLDSLLKTDTGYWPSRIIHQLAYAHELSKMGGGQYDGLIEGALQKLVTARQTEQTVTKSAAQVVEALLLPLSPAAKHYQMICAGHAHIDMNWMWRWDETVSISLDTFRTVLDLMNEYPDFTFSQSQASVYRIVEEYAPQMLEEIRQRVKEGRWEVTASTWVETDKNMPNGESLARHILYTKRYLQRLLGLAPETLNFDFEPDTFGHNRNVPEILTSGGVRYYYHCRGDQGDELYRWKAPSGREIVVYREPLWYLGYIEPGMALYAPAFCEKYGLTTMLKVYGVGDHGGGPTRRDLERIMDMDTWPVFPRIKFGTFSQYFAEVEPAAARLPEVQGELNFVFTGCYSSQSRIKKANRLGEVALNQAETYAALAAVNANHHYPVEAFAGAWKNLLFNQFHDIIPGSGVIDTREYALGRFQDALATANSQARLALRALAQAAGGVPNVLTNNLRQSIAEGAGVGFGVEEFRLAQVSRGGGEQRVFHIANPAPWRRHEVVELVVWDWDGELERIVFKDAAGKPLPHQVLDRGFNPYWGHNYLRVLVALDLPAGGLTSCILERNQQVMDTPHFPLDPRVELPDEFILENEQIKAIFDTHNCALISLVDIASGEPLVSPARPAGFRLIQEEDRKGMTAWVVGRYMHIDSLAHGVHVVQHERGSLRQWLTWEVTFGSSKLKVTASLDASSRQVDFNVECDWQEIGRPGQGVPQLNFNLPLAFACRGYRYDIPFGMVERPALELDVPGNSWGFALREGRDKPSALVITESTYAFRGQDDGLALTLTRSSYDPDPYPEVGIHKLRFAVAAMGADSPNHALMRRAYDSTHPAAVFSGSGTNTPEASFVELVQDNCMVSAVKLPEDDPSGNKLLIRLYETEGEPTTAQLRFSRPVQQAALVDINEALLGESQPAIDGDTVAVPLGAFRLVNLLVTF